MKSSSRHSRRSSRTTGSSRTSGTSSTSKSSSSHHRNRKTSRRSTNADVSPLRKGDEADDEITDGGQKERERSRSRSLSKRMGSRRQSSKSRRSSRRTSARSIHSHSSSSNNDADLNSLLDSTHDIIEKKTATQGKRKDSSAALDRIPSKLSSRGSSAMLDAFRKRSNKGGSSGASPFQSPTSAGKHKQRSSMFIRKSQSGANLAVASTLANSPFSWSKPSSKKNSNSLGDMNQDSDSEDSSSGTRLSGSSQRNATFATRTSTIPKLQALPLYQNKDHISSDHSDHRRTSAIMPSSYNPMSASLVRDRSSFSTHSALVAQSFLGDYGDDMNDSAHTREAFLDEYNPLSGGSSHHTRGLLNKTSYSDNSQNRLDDFGHDNNLDNWDPEDQRKQIQNSPKKGATPSSVRSVTTSNKSINNSMFARPDLRDVDQTVNLMDCTGEDDSEYYEEAMEGDAMFADGHQYLQNVSLNINHGNHSEKVGFMKQTNTSLVDIFLDASERGGFTRSQKKKKKRKKRKSKKQTTYLQDICRFCCNKKLCLALLCLVGVAAIALTLWKIGGFVFKGTSATNENSAVVAPQEKDLEELKQFLVDRQVATPEQFTVDKTTPQSLALEWIFQNNFDKTTNIDQARLETFALALLYYKTNGIDGSITAPDSTHWEKHTNWMTPKPICTWYGIDCEEGESAEESTIVHLNLTSNNLQGELPHALFIALSNMRTLDLSHNRLTGELPVVVMPEGNGTPPIAESMEYLWMQENEFHGFIPTTWASLYKLRSLKIQNNRLTGVLPEQVNELADLEFLYIQNNALTGSFPYIEGMKSLKYLWFFGNQFSEHLPYEFFRLNQIVEIRGQKNDMSGTIPAEIMNLRNLRILQLDNNRIVGRLPDTFYENLELGK